MICSSCIVVTLQEEKRAAGQKMPTASFALAKDANSNLQPTIHVTIYCV